MLRRRFLPLCVAAVTILLAVPALADFTGKVVAVADGDTITVLRGTDQVKVRFDGIDAPEKKQPLGTKARRFTAAAPLRHLRSLASARSLRASLRYSPASGELAPDGLRARRKP
jgi:endonuclease YncB( thermonuclease family)